MPDKYIKQSNIKKENILIKLEILTTKMAEY